MTTSSTHHIRPMRRLAIVVALSVTAGVGLMASPADAATTRTGSCTDGAGIRWSTKVIWGSTSGGKISVAHAGWTTNAQQVRTDSTVRTYDASGSVLQTLTRTASKDYDAGTTWDARNPVDPPSGPGRTKITVKVGKDGDGKADCTVTFVQPGSSSAAPAPGATPAPTPSPTPIPTSKILFQDDFTGTAGQRADGSKWQDWSTCAYNGSAAYGKIKCGDNETLDGSGHLRIPATSDSGSSLSTAGRFAFTYGEASAWIKNPAQDGYWPAFWTLNNNPDGVDSLPVGELDVMEGYTTWDDLYHRGVLNHNGGDQGWGGPDAVCGNVDLTAGFHKYTVRLEPNKASFFFDDKPCGSVITPADGGGKPWAFGPTNMKPNWLILTLAVGGAGGQQATPTAPATMLVDRVEVRGLS